MSCCLACVSSALALSTLVLTAVTESAKSCLAVFKSLATSAKSCLACVSSALALSTLVLTAVNSCLAASAAAWALFATRLVEVKLFLTFTKSALISSVAALASSATLAVSWLIVSAYSLALLSACVLAVSICVVISAFELANSSEILFSNSSRFGTSFRSSAISARKASTSKFAPTAAGFVVVTVPSV